MAITHGAAVRDTVCNAVTAAVNAGSPGPAKLIFQTAASAAIATLNMSTTPFAAASGGSAVANPITSSTTETFAGTTTKFVIRDKSGNDIILGSVGTSGSDINLSSTTFGVGDTVSVSSLTYTAMP